MTRVVLWTMWALVPVAVLAFHLGYGRTVRDRDQAAAELRAAATMSDREDWEAAAAAYERALVLLKGAGSGERADADLLLRTEIAAARAQMYAGDYAAGQSRMEQLLQRAVARDGTPTELTDLLRDEVARAAYYAAWAMRLEGGPAEEWLDESGKAKAQYRHLAEHAERSLSASATRHREDLEAVIRFERMTLEELRALGLPKECQNCKGGLSNQKRQQKQSQSRSPRDPKDAREKINSAGGGGRSGQGW